MLHYIGDCYLEQQDFQNGLKYLWISYDQAVANGTTVNLVMFKNSLSVAYYYKGDYRESEKLIFEGLSQLTSPLDIYLKITDDFGVVEYAQRQIGTPDNC